MKRSERITLIVLALIVLFVGVFAVGRVWQQKTDPLRNLSENEQVFISTPYTTMAGESVSLKDYAGDVMVVSAWASWCPMCMTELPKLVQLADLYANGAVHVIAVNRNEPLETANDYLRSIAISTSGSLHVWLDPSDSFYRGIQGVSMPETVVYAADGTVFSHTRGAVSFDELKAIVDQVLVTDRAR